MAGVAVCYAHGVYGDGCSRIGDLEYGVLFSGLRGDIRFPRYRTWCGVPSELASYWLPA